MVSVDDWGCAAGASVCAEGNRSFTCATSVGNGPSPGVRSITTFVSETRSRTDVPCGIGRMKTVSPPRVPLRGCPKPCGSRLARAAVSIRAGRWKRTVIAPLSLETAYSVGSVQSKTMRVYVGCWPTRTDKLGAVAVCSAAPASAVGRMSMAIAVPLRKPLMVTGRAKVKRTVRPSCSIEAPCTYSPRLERMLAKSVCKAVSKRMTRSLPSSAVSNPTSRGQSKTIRPKSGWTPARVPIVSCAKDGAGATKSAAANALDKKRARENRRFFPG